MDYVSYLDEKNEIIHIHEYVNPILEITEITDRISKSPGGGKALMFHNNGTNFPLLINAFGSIRRIAYALHSKDLSLIEKRIDYYTSKFISTKSSFIDKLKLLPELKQISNWLPTYKNKKNPRCRQIIVKDPDINIFPVLKCWPGDGGKFITLPVVISKDPDTGMRNAGMYRMQIFNKNTTAMHWHKHKNAARHYQLYKEKRQKMPIAVILGGDPVYTYCATAPLPDNIDEFLLAGFLRNKPVNFVKCLTQNLEVPDDADIVIEGYIDPEEDEIIEGPFGDHTGFYSLADYYPKFHITCITYANDAVYPATVVGVPPQEDAWIGKATERIFKKPIQISMLPELKDMHLPFYGVAHNLAFVSIKKQFAEHAHKIKNALWGAGQFMFNKVLVIFNDNIDIQNQKEVFNTIIKNVNPESDIDIGRGPLDILDHSSQKQGFGSKLMIDATQDGESDNIVFNLDDLSVLLEKVPDIEWINDEYIKNGIPVINLTINNVEITINKLKQILVDNSILEGIKLIILTESFAKINDANILLWYVLNNIDPERDCIIIKRSSSSVLIVNACRKPKLKHVFERDWPNVVVMDDETINKVDEKWDKLGLGDFIESPSNKLKYLNENEGAIANFS